MATTLLSVRIEDETKTRLEALAEATGRSKNALFNEAVERYIAEQEKWLAQVREGLDDIAAGRVVPHEDVVRQLIAKGYMTSEGYAQALAELDQEFPPRHNA